MTHKNLHFHNILDVDITQSLTIINIVNLMIKRLNSIMINLGGNFVTLTQTTI